MKHKSLLLLVYLLFVVFTNSFAANNSLYLDGSGDYATLGTDKTNDGMSGATGLTVEAWINPSSLRTGVSRNVIVDFCRDSAYSMVMFYLTDSGKLRFGGRSTATDSFEGVQTTTAVISTGGWQHVAGVLDFTNKAVYLYVDGVLVLSRATVNFHSNTYVSTVSGSTEFIGANYGLTATQFFHGYIDDLRIWRTPRTLQQIQDNMDVTIPAQSNLLGYWKFDETSGTTANDTSGSGYNATLMGNAGFADGNPTLPVELSSFTANINSSNMVMLQWVTQSETNVSGFQIYRGLNDDLAEATLLDIFINATNTSQTQYYVYYDRELDAAGTYYYWLESVDFDGSIHLFGPIPVHYESIDPGIPSIPAITGIAKNYPNPFNPSTTIVFGMKLDGELAMDVYNARGQKVRSIYQGSRKSGWYRLEWDGKNDDGQQLSSGVYFFRMQANGETYLHKTVMLK